jgi:hypothetical protein
MGRRLAVSGGLLAVVGGLGAMTRCTLSVEPGALSIALCP